MTVELYRQHKSINKVAKIIGISFSSVQTELKKIGEPVQGRGGYRIGDKRYGGKCRRDC
jgi:transposase-like protein